MTTTTTDIRVKTLLDSLGYPSLYPTQELALSKGVLEGKNLLITTPTASGKTLIAIMAAMKAIESGVKVVYLTPLRALATEKYQDFRILESLNNNIIGKQIRVRVASSDYDSKGMDMADADIVVLTNEKMDSLIRHRTEWISDVGLFVADEVHLIGERERGPTLEMMLTKIRKMYSQSQILALSATVSNSADIADWLGCKLIESNWRPTKLVEGVYEYGTVHMNDGRELKIETSSGISSAAIDIAIDSLNNGGQALIFAETRKRASSLATKAAIGVYKRLDKDSRRAAAEMSSQILIKGDDTDLTRTLAQLVSKGVAFHHAGLGPSSREIVESAFKAGIIKLLIATPTLAAGVNLPARRVILASILRYDSEYGGSMPISVLEYKQLCGRAGRPKYDTFGESVIVAESGVRKEDLYDHYVLGNPEPLRSQLTNDKAVRAHLLSSITTLPGMKKSEIYDLFESTLFAKQYKKLAVAFKLDAALSYLESEDLVKSKNDRYIATEFGRRTSLLYIDPLTAVEFRKAIESIKKKTTGARTNSDNDDDNDNNNTIRFLHLITNSADFYPKLSLRKKDLEQFNKVIIERHDDNDELFYPISEYDDCSRSLWALYEWIDETTDRMLSDKLGVEPGDMHRMVEIAEWLAYSLYEVAKLLRREDLLQEIHNLRVRIKYGVREELLPLITLERIGRVRARALYDAGLTDVKKVAKSSESKLSAIPKIGPAVAKNLKEQLRKNTDYFR
ncbi:MAG TPA: DEAD/DEAH box helicase [Nitrososphaeraceae archaeon]|nr:DEAD/DEAH box helicase [Nitrososphaeraceae archaeon]